MRVAKGSSSAPQASKLLVQEIAGTAQAKATQVLLGQVLERELRGLTQVLQAEELQAALVV
jgi:hypothetical protein